MIRDHIASLDILPLELRNAPIVVIGAGATGSFTIFALTKMGFSNITVYDFDKIEPHNVDNQLYGKPHIGMIKVHALRTIVKGFSGEEVTAINEKFEKQSIPAGSILIIAVDDIEIREAIWNQVKSTNLKAYIDTRMGAELFQIYTIKNAVFPEVEFYQGTFFPASEAAPVRCTEKSIMYTPFVLGGDVANQVKKILKGEHIDQEILHDFKTNTRVSRSIYGRPAEEKIEFS